MSSVWETLYLIKPPPADANQSPAVTSPSDKTPLFQYNKVVEKFSFAVPSNFVFFEERSQNGCPKVLRIHLLGHDGCEEHFGKYMETVEALEFHGCLENFDSCFKICSLMTKLKDVRFYIGRNIPIQLQPLKLCQSKNFLDLPENDQVKALRIVTDLVLYNKQSIESRNIINELLEMTIEYAITKFRNIHDLRIEIPDSNRLLSLSRDLMRLPKLLRHPKLEITLDYRIYAKIESIHPHAPKRSPSLFMASPDSSESGPTCSSVQNKEVGNQELDKKTESSPDEIKIEANIQKATNEVDLESTQAQNAEPVPNKIYSYEMSTTARLLQESGIGSVDLPGTNPSGNKKRAGDPLVNSNKPKRVTQENLETPRRDSIHEHDIPHTLKRDCSDRIATSSQHQHDDDHPNIPDTSPSDNRHYRNKNNRSSSKEERWDEPTTPRSRSQSRSRVAPSRDDGRSFSSSSSPVYYRRGDLREDRSPDPPYSNRREPQNFATRSRSRGSFRGSRSRGSRSRGRPYRGRGDRSRSYEDER